MPKWIAKISWSRGQCRVTIPKALVEEMGWQDVPVLVMAKTSPYHLLVRRFMDGESLEPEKPTDQFKRD